MIAADPLSELVRTHFAQLAHAGDLEADARTGTGTGTGAGGGADAGADRICRGEAGREAIGTRVRFELRVAGRRIAEARFRAYGCPHTLAVCEWLAGELEGQNIHDINIGLPMTWAAYLNVPSNKLGRLLIVEDALLAALAA